MVAHGCLNVLLFVIVQYFIIIFHQNNGLWYSDRSWCHWEGKTDSSCHIHFDSLMVLSTRVLVTTALLIVFRFHYIVFCTWFNILSMKSTSNLFSVLYPSIRYLKNPAESLFKSSSSKVYAGWLSFPVVEYRVLKNFSTHTDQTCVLNSFLWQLSHLCLNESMSWWRGPFWLHFTLNSILQGQGIAF